MDFISYSHADDAHKLVNSLAIDTSNSLALKIDLTEKGAINGVVPLNGSGQIDSAFLPSFIDDVLEFSSIIAFPATGESGKIYVDLNDNKTYRWGGSSYVYITSGAVDSVAGKTGIVTLVKGDVGLANVDDTSDLNKPISTATQTALTAITNSISNVDNTSDLNKPISTSTQSALDLKEDKSQKGIANGYASLDGDAKIPSAQLPSFVDDILEYANLASFPATGEAGKIYIALDTNKSYRWSGTVYVYITSGAVDSVAGKTGIVTLVKGDVGLENVDNTSDLNKPISTATQSALTTITNSISNVDNTSDLNKPISTATQSALDSKEDSANKGVANGYASLDANALIPTTQLPSFVDDVLEYANFASFPPVDGDDTQTGKIYVALDTNKTYRFSGSAYVYITSGAVDSVAGKTGIVFLNKNDVALSNVDNTSDLDKPISTATQTALNGKLATTANAVSASKLLTARNIVISGDATGTVAFDGTTNVDLSVNVTDSEKLNGQLPTYYAVATDIKDSLITVVAGSGLVTGGNFSLNQALPKTITIDHEDTSTQATVTNTGQSVIQSVSVDGFGHVTSLASLDLSTVFLGLTATASDSSKFGAQLPSYYLNAGNLTGTLSAENLALTISSDTTGNAATATALATTRSISLTGDATGSANFNGSANATITVTVADDSHIHDTRYYTQSTSNTKYMNKTPTTIADLADLNTFTTSGNFTQDSDVFATNGTNYPVDAKGLLEVISNTAFIIQRYFPYATSGVYYLRAYQSSVWGSWELIEKNNANTTLQGNTFNGANQLVQLDGTSKLPAIDGSQLLNLPGDGVGDMLKVTYDTTANGVVDDSEKLGGVLPSGYVDVTSIQTIAGAKTFSSAVIFNSDVTMNGTTTIVNSTTVQVDDKNIELGSVDTPTDITADGGGITLKGDTDKTIIWVNATNTWDFNCGINVNGKFTATAAGATDTHTLENASGGFRFVPFTGGVNYFQSDQNMIMSGYSAADLSLLDIRATEVTMNNDLSVFSNLNLGSSQEATINYNATEGSIDFLIN